MTKNSIIEKVQKLLELQKGAEAIGSLEEAANAAEKVQRLLIKYNLELADIAEYEPEKKAKVGRAACRDIYAKKNEGQWIYRLYTVLANHNFCQVILFTYRMENGKKNMYVNLIGTRENVTVVKFLSDQLESRIRVLEKKAWENRFFRQEKRNAFRRAYFMGACEGINAQLKDAKVRAMQENVKVTDLVVQTDKELADAIKKMFPNLKEGRMSKSLSARMAGMMGYNDGKSMNINRGIDGLGNTEQLK